MIDGFFAFILCTILVWFALGIAKPSIALPPLVMGFLEDRAAEPTRKMVVQWSAVFLMALLALVMVVGALSSESNYEKQKSEVARSAAIVGVKHDMHKLIMDESIAIDSKNLECAVIVQSHTDQLHKMVQQFDEIEQLSADGKRSAMIELNKVSDQISQLQKALDTVDCK